jgi:hypothetical protein
VGVPVDLGAHVTWADSGDELIAKIARLHKCITEASHAFD